MLQAIRVSGHIGHDGILKLEVPLQLIDQDVEAMVVVQAAASKALVVDANGYPIGFLTHFCSRLGHFLSMTLPHRNMVCCGRLWNKRECLLAP